MELKNKDILHHLFAGVPDEALPADFNKRVMHKVMAKAALREKKRKYLEIFGYASGGITMLAVCVLTFYFFDISIKLPEFDLQNWSFPKPDYELFKSQSFLFSLFIGVAALFLLIVDSTIRHKIERNKKQSV